VALAIFVVVISLGYAFTLRWVGVVVFKDATYKTLLDWLTLLIIPAVLEVGGYLFTRSETHRAQEIADERRQDDRLQAYLDQMGQLLLDKDRPLRQTELHDEARIGTGTDVDGVGETRRIL
jgi:hypothetical protein